MENLLTIMGGALGILVPFLLVYLLNKGIANTPFETSHKADLKNKLAVFVGGWTILIWILSLSGLFSYHSGDTFPRLLIGLVAPVLIGVLLLTNKSFKIVLDNTPLAALVGVQTFRFAGAAFLLVVYLGILPDDFAQGGYGDLLTGFLALIASMLLHFNYNNRKLFFWLFSMAGLLDLANVAFLILKYYPIWNSAPVNSAPMADFSLVMIPVIAAPIAMLLHIYAIIKALKKA